MIYAQLDMNNVCVGLSQLSDEVNESNMLQIEFYDTALIGKKFEDGKWIELPQEPVIPTPEEPTNTEVLQTVNNLIADLTIAGVI